jgi:hypothetical protein
MSLARFLCAKTREIVWTHFIEHFIFIHVHQSSNHEKKIAPSLPHSISMFDHF